MDEGPVLPHQPVSAPDRLAPWIFLHDDGQYGHVDQVGDGVDQE
jgi:hypothetical protein